MFKKCMMALLVSALAFAGVSCSDESKHSDDNTQVSDQNGNDQQGNRDDVSGTDQNGDKTFDREAALDKLQAVVGNYCIKYADCHYTALSACKDANFGNIESLDLCSKEAIEAGLNHYKSPSCTMDAQNDSSFELLKDEAFVACAINETKKAFDSHYDEYIQVECKDSGSDCESQKAYEFVTLYKDCRSELVNAGLQEIECSDEKSCKSDKYEAAMVALERCSTPPWFWSEPSDEQKAMDSLIEKHCSECNADSKAKCIDDNSSIFANINYMCKEEAYAAGKAYFSKTGCTADASFDISTDKAFVDCALKEVKNAFGTYYSDYVAKECNDSISNCEVKNAVRFVLYSNCSEEYVNAQIGDLVCSDDKNVCDKDELAYAGQVWLQCFDKAITGNNISLSGDDDGEGHESEGHESEGQEAMRELITKFCDGSAACYDGSKETCLEYNNTFFVNLEDMCADEAIAAGKEYYSNNVCKADTYFKVWENKAFIACAQKELKNAAGEHYSDIIAGLCKDNTSSDCELRTAAKFINYSGCKDMWIDAQIADAKCAKDKSYCDSEDFNSKQMNWTMCFDSNVEGNVFEIYYPAE